GVCVAMMAALALLVYRTRLGTAMRATAQNPQVAGLMGVDINRVIAATFVIGAALGAVAGVLFGTYYGVAQYTMGSILGLKAFSASASGIVREGSPKSLARPRLHRHGVARTSICACLCRHGMGAHRQLRHPLRAARARPQHRGRLCRAARSGLHRLLRDRRLHLRAASQPALQSAPALLDHPADRRAHRGDL